MFTRQVFGFKRETLRNTSSMLARATPDEALVLGESFMAASKALQVVSERYTFA